jgi:hypothetical protein
MTPDIIRLIMFLAMVTIFQGGIDYYIFRKYRNYLDIVEVQLPIWKQGYATIALIMLILLIGTTIERLITGSNVQSGHIIQIFIAIWYLPKYPLAVVFLVKDSIVIFNRIIKRFKTVQLSTEVTTTSTERRKVLHSIAATASLLPFLGTAHGVLRMVYEIKTNYLEIVLPKLHRNLDGFRIVHISDIHTGSFFSTNYLQDAVRLINIQKPDIIAITGDYVNFDPVELQMFLPVLRDLQARIGVFGSLGNHDHYMTPEKHTALCSMIRSTGIELLINKAKVLRINNAELVIAGTDNTGFNQRFGDLVQTFNGIPSDIPSILMAHDPTYWNMEIKKSRLADITLSGHTHGGQVGVEFLGETYSPAQFVYEHWSGLYKEDDMYLYVNQGLGTVGPPIRFAIPPEITVITLRSAIA